MSDTPIPHGTTGGYCNHACRCDLCRAAQRVSFARHRANRYAERILIGDRLVHPNAAHGTARAYEYWGCRCAECRTANTASKRRRRGAS